MSNAIYNPNTRILKFIMNKEDIFDFFETKNFHFSKEIITRFFISLQTKPFVILSGISGAGKTKIAQIFADYICQNETAENKNKRITFIPVRPDWMDNKGLLGYYNLLDAKYYLTPFLKCLINAKDEPDKSFFIILDEMNLSKVEMYFSDILSLMETRTKDNPDGESLELHNLQELMDASDNFLVPDKLNIPPNVYFIGTVNVDETTYMFSPKVLDRANVIEFNEVDMEEYSNNATKEEKFVLHNQQCIEIFNDNKNAKFASKEDYNKYLEIIKEHNKENPLLKIHNILKKYNMHFGYRVINEISRFIVLSKELIVDNFYLNETFDIQIIQKILPKFHGTRGKLEEVLKELFLFCYDTNENNSNNSNIDVLLEKAFHYDKEAIFPRSAQKIARMLKSLHLNGYASFIE